MERFYNSVNNVACSSDGLYTTMIKMLGLNSPQKMRTKVLGLLCSCALIFSTSVLVAQVDCATNSPSVDFDGATDETCDGASDGTITVGGFSGIPPYIINLYSGATATGTPISTTTGTNPTVFSDLPGGTYSVEVTNYDPNAGAGGPVTVTLNSSTPPNAFMNAWDIPCTFPTIATCNYAAGFGYDPNLSSAVYDASGALIVGAPVIDAPTDPFWYDASLNSLKFVESLSFYQEDGPLSGQDVNFTIEVTENTLACGLTSCIFIRDFAPDFSSFEETKVAINGPGEYTASLTTIDDPARHVQYGFATYGSHVLPADAAACGSITALAVTNESDVCSDVLEGIEIANAPTFPAFVVLGVDENGLVSDVINNGCDNNCDASVSIVPGPPTAGLEYSLDGGPFGASNIFTGLCGGTHTATIRYADNTDCTSSISFEITPETASLPTAGADVNACAGTLAASLEATCDDGCTVNWYAEQIGSSVLATGETFDPIAIGAVNSNVTGTYTFWAECDCSPCISDRAPVALIINPTPEAVTIIGATSACPGSTEAYTVDPVNAASTYEWFLNGTSQGTGAQLDITFDATTESNSVSVTETDENGCSTTTSTSVTVEVNQTMGCKSTVVASLGSNCDAHITAGIFVQNNAYPSSSYEIVSVTNDETGVAVEVDIDGGFTVTEKGTYTVSVGHTCSGNTCWSTLIAEDNTQPTLECPATKLVACDGDLKPVWPDDYPAVDDNCCIDADNIDTYTYTDSNIIPGINFEGFSGEFAAANWTEVITGGDGTTDFSGDGNTLTIVSDDSGTGDVTQTSVVYTFTLAGDISFNWDFTTADPGFEFAAIVVDADGVQTDIVPLVDASANGVVVSYPINVGETIIIAALSQDGLFGSGTLTLTNFSFLTAETVLDPDDECEGGVYRTWQVTDCCGNVSESCGQIVRRFRPDVVDFPADVNLQCDNDNDPSTDPSDTGYPTIDIDGVAVSLDGKVCKYIATYTDINVPAPCANKIIREWTVFDWCEGEIYDIQDQFITVMDNAAPAISCPDDASVASNAAECVGTYTIPSPTVTDGCSNTSLVITLSDGSVVSAGTTITINGSETITYTAADDCGNATDPCTQIVTVSDQTAPVAICDQNTVVSIGTDGLGLVCATTVDDGSYDNCSDDLIISVKRMDAPNNVPFTPCVEFDCTDVGETVIVRFRVSDGTGFGECMVNVNVQDKIGPAITCPPNKDLNCNADFYPNEVDSSVSENLWNASYNGELIGYYPFVDNCGPVTIDISDEGALDLCGEGTILRTWTASDAGASVSCVQTISIFKTAIATFTGDDVVGDDDDIAWPIDVDLDCTEFQDDNSLTDPSNAGEPELIGEEDDCAQLFIGHTDQLLYNDPNACYKILRTWKVIDHCQYDPDNGIYDGYWQHVQLIKVNDQTAPVFDNCDDEIIFVDAEDGCFGDIVITKTAADACDTELDYTWTLLAEDGFTYNGNGSTIDGTYDVGTHTVTWTATDNCGNEETCTHLLKVSDGKKPTPVCIVLYTAVMPTTGSVEIWATDFESGSSFDNCTAHEDLNHYILPGDATLPASDDPDISDLPTNITFNCDQLGYQNVYVFVEDESGSWDYCLTQVWINDSQCSCPNNPDCGGTAQPMIQGYIETEMHDMVEHVDINVSGSSATTDADGLFNFLNLASNNNYVVTPSKDINWANGVTTFDLVLISQHILGVQPLGSPYKIIAADANMSNTVTTLDLVKIQRLILGLDTDFAPNTSWRFVDMDFVFPNNDNPFETTFPEVISYNNLTSSEMYTDFVGVKIGDVNDSATPNALLGSALRNTNGSLEFEMDDRAMKAGETYEVAIKANDFNNVLGFQYTINVENAEILDVVPGTITTAENFGMSEIANGTITTSWFSASSTTLKNDEVVYTIKLKANENTRLSNVLSVSSKITRAEAYNNNADLLDVAFNFTNSSTTATAFELYQNRPNPFKANTAIGFNLPEAGTVTLSIMDLSGKVLRQSSNDFAKGYNEFTLNNNIEGTGVFYYRIETATDTATKKMIILE